RAARSRRISSGSDLVLQPPAGAAETTGVEDAVLRRAARAGARDVDPARRYRDGGAARAEPAALRRRDRGVRRRLGACAHAQEKLSSAKLRLDRANRDCYIVVVRSQYSRSAPSEKGHSALASARPQYGWSFAQQRERKAVSLTSVHTRGPRVV